MLHLMASCTNPLLLVGCGHLVNPNNFQHIKRKIENEFVLIMCTKGALHMDIGGNRYDIGTNQCALLLPGIEHSGYKPSTGGVSYYWCHFTIWGDDYKILDEEEAAAQLQYVKSNPGTPHDQYIIPEVMLMKSSERVILQFRQLLDAAEQEFYSGYLVHYALSLLGLEITTNFVMNFDIANTSTTYKHIVKIMEWIKAHYTEDLNVTRVAEEFHYHPGYISSVFKKYSGKSLLEYINRTKIDAAKERLLSSNESIKQIAAGLGFSDDKYFMKLFKRLEGTTPSKYRNAFYRKFLNRH